MNGSLVNPTLNGKWNLLQICIVYKLEQLECLSAEIPLNATWLPILVIRIRSQVKTRQSQGYKI